MNVRPQHSPEEPIGIVRSMTTEEFGRVFHIEIGPGGESRLISDEVAEKLYAATIRPWSFGFLEAPLMGRGLAYWQDRERAAIHAAALRWQIPRVIRSAIWSARYRLAHWLYPDAFYEEDD